MGGWAREHTKFGVREREDRKIEKGAGEDLEGEEKKRGRWREGARERERERERVCVCEGEWRQREKKREGRTKELQHAATRCNTP